MQINQIDAWIAITRPTSPLRCLFHMVFISGFDRLGGSEDSFPVVAKSLQLQNESVRERTKKKKKARHGSPAEVEKKALQSCSNNSSSLDRGVGAAQ